ncbi:MULTISPECIES: hypothetical protein [unclassified Anaerobiospirillum]|uniref:hypothetical protein n=1 Tax=unclassified Anaerobiospirillum TaxID=2647410 RepID=UPI001FF2552C|nr:MULTISPECIES: hypothetical protein [unclassified Anaerobiospirillum]MCK0533942.1 hypothetical protein [Anaerobiospirillum sp. NML120511]MCK0539145.1 hypothetical protein [Anaerobiospirillum sp. NML02-A-032]
MAHMDDLITRLFSEYRDYIWLLFGLILVVGSVRNWNWLCDPVGKPDYLLLTRGMLRFIFFCLGILLIGCSLYFVI